MIDISTVLIIVLLIGAFFILIKRYNSVDEYEVKPSPVKKEEVIQAYEQEVKELLQNYKDDEAKLLEEKKNLIKRINNELKMNLFFDDEEAKEVINRLLKLS